MLNFPLPLSSLQTILAQTGDPASHQQERRQGTRQEGGRPRARALRPLETDDDPWNAPVRRLTRAEVEALRRRQPTLSPWAVIGAQALLGIVLAALAWLVFDRAVAASALYGAAVSALPGALMARAATSGRAAPGSTGPVAQLPPALSAFRLMTWAVVKIGVSVLLLALAPRLVQPLSWPALLTALVLCLQVYWFALLWRGRAPQRSR